MVEPRDRREIVFESILERNLAYILIAHPAVQFLYDQPEAVFYRDLDDMERRHTFDFLVELKSGRRVAYAVKPQERVERSGIERTLNLVRQQVVGFADEFKLCTERHITPTRADNARQIVRALRMRDEETVAKVKKAALLLKGAVPIEQLLSISVKGPEGLCAALCLMGDGVLKKVSGGRLSMTSHVSIAPQWRKIQQQ